jgi:L-ascorbate metabolism protein UlaG (beta-lactamase superfamily)
MLSLFSPAFGQAPVPAHLRHSPQFDGKVFRNPVGTQIMNLQEMPAVLSRRWQRKGASQPGNGYLFREGQRDQLLQPGLALNWLGHASVLMHIEGRYYLTDPVFSERVSPFAWMGPKRFFPSPVAAAALPPLEAILISHDHYDHLDHPTIRALKNKTRQFIVPLGVRATLEYWGVEAAKITELDWGETAQTTDFEVTALPARHFSGRGFTRNHTLWCAYALDHPQLRVFFGGDSGYFPQYPELGEKYGPFDLTLMPIGAYDEAWADIHLNPEEALTAHRELRGNYFFPTHWGTYDLALHSWHEPIERLVAAAGEVPLLTPAPGNWWALKQEEGGLQPWWERFV